jgi:hypothetical protein
MPGSPESRAALLLLSDQTKPAILEVVSPKFAVVEPPAAIVADTESGVLLPYPGGCVSTTV